MNCPCKLYDHQLMKDWPYQKRPCSKCDLAKESYNVGKHTELFDTDGAIQAQEALNIPAQELIDQEDLVPDNVPSNVINLITRACEQNMIVTLSNIILKLVSLSKSYPALFQILMLKMQHPDMSYYQIGQVMVPPCSKQNVLYHLQHAVQQFPQLCNAILIDSRFSGGRFAIRRVADEQKKLKHTTQVQHLLYASTEINTEKTMEQLRALFLEPYKEGPIAVYDEYAKESDSELKD